MRKAMIVLFLLVATTAAGQGDLVFKAGVLTWDYTPVQMTVLEDQDGEFRMHCQVDTPGVVVGAPTLVGTIIPPIVIWPIILDTGHWYCVVVAAVPAESYVSGPSNEWEGTVVDLTPGGLRKEQD